MTVEPYQIPKRLFIFYLKEVAGLNKEHRRQIANTAEQLAKEMGDPEHITMEDLKEVRAPAPWVTALMHYHQFAKEFLPIVKKRKGEPLNFVKLAREYGISTNQVKKIFGYFLVDYHRSRAEFVTLDGYLVQYVMTKKDMALFREYLKREARKDERRARTYQEFLASEKARMRP